MAALAKIDLQSLIYSQAIAQGIPPAIALAVAQKESGTSQWTSSGGLVTGTSGEVGVFQLMPTTAASLGVDPTDINQNIQGGVSFLAQLYQKYGNWPAALSAYNSGSPTGSPSYASSVLAIAASFGSSVASAVSSALSPESDSSGVTAADLTSDVQSPFSGALVVGLILGGVALAWWALAD